MISLSDAQKQFLDKNGLSVTEENQTYTLHYVDHECKGLSECELKHTIDEYISGKYCSYKPNPTIHEANMARDD